MSLPKNAYRSLLFEGRSTLQLAEVEAKLGVTKRHLINLIEAGQLNAVNISKMGSPRVHYRIPVESYEEFIAARLLADAGCSPLFEFPKPALENLYNRLKAHLKGGTDG
ncbi:hypothetical protein DDZ13_07335 [Coraliomargarita sinensis]|uniref:Helix-turn-helix domain-containing protein n=1 Tax=Coraliomargarita sinensis TaxID=2174842 RepID=A0A317ZJB9_9BACT|nr:helix-turn-helix domain-containing protein [Coraliomargarita sinensis]PXA04337.1 hypothetical protein DDZ13_07335 [Coraliomargarita sinensis]